MNNIQYPVKDLITILFTFQHIKIRFLTIKKHEHKRHTPQHITIYRSDKLVYQTSDKKHNKYHSQIGSVNVKFTIYHKDNGST